MEFVVNKTIFDREGELVEGEALVLYPVGPSEGSLPEVLALERQVKTGTVTFFQMTVSLSRALRGINQAIFRLLTLLAPLSSIEGSETATVSSGGKGAAKYVEISVPGARTGMVPSVNPPAEIMDKVSALWPAIVDDDFVRIYYVPNEMMLELDVVFKVRVVK